MIPEVGWVGHRTIVAEKGDGMSSFQAYVRTTDVFEIQAIRDTECFSSAMTDGGPAVRSCKIGYGFCFSVPHSTYTEWAYSGCSMFVK